MALNEFDLIATYFQKGGNRADVILGIGDDCAILNLPSDKYLVVSTDTLNVGSHFFEDTPAFDIGYKSVAVSLSDLAAMGAEPAWLLLSLTLPEVAEPWLSAFSQGLFACLTEYQVELVGGNTAKGPLSVTTQAMGFVDPKHPITRRGARPGDSIYVTHTLGDAGLALALLKGTVDTTQFDGEERAYLMGRLGRPTPRIKEGLGMVGVASAAIDLSDGLLGDLGHILSQSAVGATLYLDKIPYSQALSKIDASLRAGLVLTAGDDYELCCTVPADQSNALEALGAFTCIGEIEAQTGLRILQKDGSIFVPEDNSYRHF